MFSGMMRKSTPISTGSDCKEQAPEPEQEQEPEQKKSDNEYPQLDLVFMCDCTGSMDSYIHAAQQNICSIVERVVSSERAEVRFALVSYRDHPPEDSSYVTQVHAFTSDPAVMKSYVDTMSAAGGGDGPEAVTAALHDALHLPWRPHATKISILIADAPPHGIEPRGDGFPNGDPLSRDPLTIARKMAAEEITCYTVGCEPALGGYHNARDFMCTLAEITGGQAIALGSAALLAEVIVNGSSEEISMTMLSREVEQEVEHVRLMARKAGEDLDDERVYERAAVSLHGRNMRTKQMRTDGGRMQNSHHSVWHKAGNKQTLAAAKAELCAAEPMELDSGMPSCSTIRSAELSRGFRKKSARAPARTSIGRVVGGAVASIFSRGSRHSEPEAMRGPCRLSLDSCDEISDCTGYALESAAAAAPSESRRRRSASPPAASAVMSKSELAEDLISVDQISRIAAKSAHRKCGK